MIKKLTLSITLLLLIVVANFAPLVTEKVEAQGSNNQNSIQWSITPVTFTTTVSTFSVSVTASSPQAAGIINNEAVARIYAAGINLTTGGASGGWFSTYLKEIPFSIAGSGATLQGSLNITGLDPQTNYQMLVQLPRVAVYSPIVTFNTDQTGQNNGGQIDQSSGADVSGAGEQTDRTATLPTCSLNPLSFHFAGCIAQGVYYIFFVPTSFVFALSGQLLDWAMGYTLDSNSYSGAGAGFVEKGWKITRDIANIFFIFILLYTAIGMILELHSVNAKKTIATVVVVALLLNFSLFFTKIIIDSSNILGGIFYNNIGTSNADTVPNPWINPNTKNVSTAIVSRFNPQKIFQDSTQLNVQTSSGIKDVNEDGPQATQFLIVSLIMAVINCIGIWVFLVVGFLFIGRVIGLWIAMIFAPIAFVSYTLPDGAGKILGDMHHSKWWDTLLKQAFVVPIFMFFMYLILAFLNTNFYKDALASKTQVQSILGVIIPLLLITILLLKAKKIATDMSGEIGGAMTKVATMAGGAALGLAAGGAAILGRQTIGRAANYVSENQTVRDMASGKYGKGSKLVGDLVFKSSSTVAKGSMDLRNTAAGNLASQQSGMNFNKGLSFVGLDTKSTAGGWQGKEARKATKDQEYAKSLGYDHHSYEHAEEEINTEKDELVKYKSLKVTAENEVAEAKNAVASTRNPDTEAALAKATAKLSRVKSNINAMENGGEVVKINDKGEKVDSAGKVIKDTDPSTTRSTDGINKMEKDKERIKTAREKEFYANKRRESGKVFEDDIRDKNGNVKKFGKEIKKGESDERKEIRGKKFTENEANKGKLGPAQATLRTANENLEKAKKGSDKAATDAAQAAYTKAENEVKSISEAFKKSNQEFRSADNHWRRAKVAEWKYARGAGQMWSEFKQGFAKGVVPGAVVGSFLPGGTIVGALGGGVLGGLRESFMQYSGTTNRHTADGHAPNTKYESSYKEPSGGGHTETHEEHHDEPAPSGGHEH